MREVLRGYTEQIIREAWPQQRQGRIPREGVEWMHRLQVQLFSFEPITESQKIVHVATLRAYENLVQQRRQRLDSMHAGIPSVLWYVLLPGAMACIGLCFFFHVDDGRFQSIVLLGLAGFLAMVLFVIISLDRPLCGQMSIGSESYQLIYDHNMRSSERR